jgi:hypothetical protein
VQEEGSLPSERGGEGGAKRRSAQAEARKIRVPLARARGGASQEGLVYCWARSARDRSSLLLLQWGSALRAGTGARSRGWRMTYGAGRRHGGDFLPLNRPEEKDAILWTGSLVVDLKIRVVWMRHEYLPPLY